MRTRELRVRNMKEGILSGRLRARGTRPSPRNIGVPMRGPCPDGERRQPRTGVSPQTPCPRKIRSHPATENSSGTADVGGTWRDVAPFNSGRRARYPPKTETQPRVSCAIERCSRDSALTWDEAVRRGPTASEGALSARACRGGATAERPSELARQDVVANLV